MRVGMMAMAKEIPTKFLPCFGWEGKYSSKDAAGGEGEQKNLTSGSCWKVWCILWYQGQALNWEHHHLVATSELAHPDSIAMSLGDSYFALNKLHRGVDRISKTGRNWQPHGAKSFTLPFAVFCTTRGTLQGLPTPAPPHMAVKFCGTYKLLPLLWQSQPIGSQL